GWARMGEARGEEAGGEGGGGGPRAHPFPVLARGGEARLGVEGAGLDGPGGGGTRHCERHEDGEQNENREDRPRDCAMRHVFSPWIRRCCRRERGQAAAASDAARAFVIGPSYAGERSHGGNRGSSRRNCVPAPGVLVTA